MTDGCDWNGARYSEGGHVTDANGNEFVCHDGGWFPVAGFVSMKIRRSSATAAGLDVLDDYHPSTLALAAAVDVGAGVMGYRSTNRVTEFLIVEQKLANGSTWFRRVVPPGGVTQFNVGGHFSIVWSTRVDDLWPLPPDTSDPKVCLFLDVRRDGVYVGNRSLFKNVSVSFNHKRSLSVPLGGMPVHYGGDFGDDVNQLHSVDAMFDP